MVVVTWCALHLTAGIIASRCGKLPEQAGPAPLCELAGRAFPSLPLLLPSVHR